MRQKVEFIPEHLRVRRLAARIIKEMMLTPGSNRIHDVRIRCEDISDPYVVSYEPPVIVMPTNIGEADIRSFLADFVLDRSIFDITGSELDCDVTVPACTDAVGVTVMPPDIAVGKITVQLNDRPQKLSPFGILSVGARILASLYEQIIADPDEEKNLGGFVRDCEINYSSREFKITLTNHGVVLTIPQNTTRADVALFLLVAARRKTLYEKEII